jgi:hypothetical protein
VRFAVSHFGSYSLLFRSRVEKFHVTIRECYYLDFQNKLYLPTFFHLTSFFVLASSSNALCTVFWFRPNFSAFSLGVWGSEVRESWTFCRVFSDNYTEIFGYFADLYNTEMKERLRRDAYRVCAVIFASQIFNYSLRMNCTLQNLQAGMFYHFYWRQHQLPKEVFNSAT